MKKLSLSCIGFSLLLVACGKPVITVEQNKAEQIRNYNTVSETKSGTDSVHGKQIAFSYGALSGVDGTKANGVALLHTYENGVSVLTANLNILPAAKGRHFIVWLSDGAESAFVAAGELVSITGDARHSLTFETKADAASLTSIIVTLETTATPKTPSTRMAGGTLTPVKH